jgi:tRNA-dihydrouridine synthase 2
MNGDVTSRKEALELIKEYEVDGAMIATEAEKNPSCFRPEAEGGPHEWRSQWKTVVAEYMRLSLQVENRWGNTKYLLGQMIPGKDKCYVAMNKARCYHDVILALGLEKEEGMLEKAKAVDQRLGIPPQESRASKRARVREANKEEAPEVKTETANGDTEPAAKRVKSSETTAEVPMPAQDTATAATAVA